MKFKKLNKNFYFKKDTLELSKDLLGKIIVNEVNGSLLSGRIVETEAYLSNDPAAHSFIGKTKRNKSVFEEPGTSYVYFIYGNYYCFNISSNENKIGEAVLIRASEPLIGIEKMKANISRFNLRRKNIKDKEIKDNKICNGPGKLCLALGINKSHDGLKLWDSKLYIAEDGYEVNENDIVSTKRIGIKKAIDKPLRFYIKGNNFISRK